MFIKFANTRGWIFEQRLWMPDENSEDTTISAIDPLEVFMPFDPKVYPIESFEFGMIKTFRDGIVVVDRDEFHDISQVSIDDLLIVLQQLLVRLYPQQPRCDIFLPRMSPSLMQEAEIQNRFQNILLLQTTLSQAQASNANQQYREHRQQQQQPPLIVCSNVCRMTGVVSATAAEQTMQIVLHQV